MNKEDLLLENKRLKERVAELEEILDNVPAALYINQIETIGDMSSGGNIYTNSYAKNYVGYTQEEITAMGHSYLENIMHPEDLNEGEKSIFYLKDKPQGTFYSGLQRIRPKGENYMWCYVQTKVLKYKASGEPLQFISTGFVIPKSYNTHKKLDDALNDIQRERNTPILQKLTKREIEILQLIAQGLNDDSIADKLFISKHTAHTHRNRLVKKLGVANTASLVAFAVKCGLN